MCALRGYPATGSPRFGGADSVTCIGSSANDDTVDVEETRTRAI
jgi:hypothetical protein